MIYDAMVFGQNRKHICVTTITVNANGWAEQLKQKIRELKHNAFYVIRVSNAVTTSHGCMDYIVAVYAYVAATID